MYTYLSNCLILTFENAARDQITNTMWTALLQVLGMMRAQSLKSRGFFSEGHWMYLCRHICECRELCNAHSSLQSLFLSCFALSSPVCLFLMADLLLLGGIMMSYARDYELQTLERAGQEWKNPVHRSQLYKNTKVQIDARNNKTNSW